jgi:hypothetical protein
MPPSIYLLFGDRLIRAENLTSPFHKTAAHQKIERESRRGFPFLSYLFFNNPKTPSLSRLEDEATHVYIDPFIYNTI